VTLKAIATDGVDHVDQDPGRVSSLREAGGQYIERLRWLLIRVWMALIDGGRDTSDTTTSSPRSRLETVDSGDRRRVRRMDGRRLIVGNDPGKGW
jgi:hypothetical protein